MTDPAEPHRDRTPREREPVAVDDAAAAAAGAEQDHHHVHEGPCAHEAHTEEFKDYNRARVAFHHHDVAMAEAEHRKKMNHEEDHGTAGSEYVKSIVFGGLDGIVSTFSVVAAAAGSGSDYKAVLIFGLANIFADGFSMGFGEAVGGAAERDYALREQARETWEVENIFECEVAEMEEIYQVKGLSKDDAKKLVSIISKDKKVFVSFMMRDELNLLVDSEDTCGPLKQGVASFCSFIFFGFFTLYPYFSGKGKGTDYIFGISVAMTAVALIVLGCVKGFIGQSPLILSAVTMVIQGTVAGGVAYGVGALTEYIVTQAV